MTPSTSSTLTHLFAGAAITATNISAAFVTWMICLVVPGLHAWERFEVVGDSYMPLFLAMPPSALLALVCGGGVAYYLTLHVWPRSKARAAMGALALPIAAAISWGLAFVMMNLFPIALNS